MMLQPGQVFNKWTVQGFAGKFGKGVKYTCVCECGKISNVDGYSISSGHSKSCGCFGKKSIGEKNRVNSYRHGGVIGGKPTSEYLAWKSMKARCLNSKSPKFSLYGGRGITICDEWINSFRQFLDDVGLRPSNKHSLDRLNGDLGYFKENVRWADIQTQNKNRSNRRWIEVGGETLSLKEFCRKHNVKYRDACKRWKLGGRTLEQLSDLVGQ